MESLGNLRGKPLEQCSATEIAEAMFEERWPFPKPNLPSLHVLVAELYRRLAQLEGDNR